MGRPEVVALAAPPPWRAMLLCAIDGVLRVRGCTGRYHDVTPNSDSALATAIAQQPVSISIEASSQCFQVGTWEGWRGQ